MKNKIKYFLCIISVFAFTSCYKSDLSKSMDEMNIIELKKYNKNLNDLKNSFVNDYLNIANIANGRDEEELLEIINYVNSEVIKSNVMITNESKSFFHTTSISSGSGTIIKEDEEHYYVLTNNHVIHALGNRVSYYIYDYYNNEYKASLLFNDPNYDMALLKFEKKYQQLRVTEIADDNIKENESVIAIGQPLGQRNAITFGKVLKYDDVICKECNPLESNITYPCIYYNAPTNHGNSGGMLINYNYDLVGIVTYGLTSEDDIYISGAGSPSEKILEFLNNNDFKVGDCNG